MHRLNRGKGPIMARDGRDPRAGDTTSRAAEDEAPPPDVQDMPEDDEAPAPDELGDEASADGWGDGSVEEEPPDPGFDYDDTDDSPPTAADAAEGFSTSVGEMDPGAGLDPIPEGVDDLVDDPAGLDGLRDLTDEGLADADTRGGDGLGERPDLAGGGASMGSGTGAGGPQGIGVPQNDPNALRSELGGGTRHDLGGEEAIQVPDGVMDEGGLGPEEVEPSGATAGLVGDLAGSGSPLDDGTAGGRPGMPEMADVVDDGPAKPDIGETRADVTETHITLEDGSDASLVVDDGDGMWFVDIAVGSEAGGTTLMGNEALAYIAENLPLEEIPTSGGGDIDPETWVDPAVRERLMAELEENTQYSEATWAAWQGRHVNPDPGSETGGTTEDLQTEPFHQPDFGDPADEPIGSAVPVTEDDVDPGTIDPIE